jgi:hypothetical protein
MLRKNIWFTTRAVEAHTEYGAVRAGCTNDEGRCHISLSANSQYLMKLFNRVIVPAFPYQIATVKYDVRIIENPERGSRPGFVSFRSY